MIITQHFRERCYERLGPGVDPETLAQLIAAGLAGDCADVVRFACKTSGGRRVYRCHLEGRGDIYAVLERGHSALLTVLTPGHIVGRPGKRKDKRLRGVLH